VCCLSHHVLPVDGNIRGASATNCPSVEHVSIAADAADAPNVGSASHYDLHAILDVSTGEFASADCDDGLVDGAGFPAFSAIWEF
jgi:hypothetical protein